MRFRTSMSVALCAVTVGLGAAACSSGSSSDSTATSPADAGSTPGGSPSGSPSGSVASPADPASTAAAGAGTSTPAASQQPQAGGSASRCQPTNLSFALGAKIAGTSTTQPTQVVDMTNKSSSACTMEGFPGVDLVGVANGQQNYTWPMTRASASLAAQNHQGIAKVTLQPGQTAHFDLRYLPGAPGDGNTLIRVVKMVITPPDDFTQAELTWDQSVVLQDGATHPGTFILPVVAGR